MNSDTVTVGEVCEATYVLSKSAKKARDKSKRAYEQGKHRISDAYSEKKKILYALKARCISYLYGEHDECRIHIINNNQYYYFEFVTDTSPSHDGKWTWKFHIPVSASAFRENVNQQELTVDILDGFTSKSNIEQSELSFQKAIGIVRSIDGVSVGSVVDPHQRMKIDSTDGVQLWEK